jgi:hypothetical protein
MDPTSTLTMPAPRNLLFHNGNAYDIHRTQARVLEWDNPEHRNYLPTMAIDYMHKVLEDSKYESHWDENKLMMYKVPHVDTRFTNLAVWLGMFGVRDLTVPEYMAEMNAGYEHVDDDTVATFEMSDWDDNWSASDEINGEEEERMADAAHTLGRFMQNETLLLEIEANAGLEELQNAWYDELNPETDD